MLSGVRMRLVTGMLAVAAMVSPAQSDEPLAWPPITKQCRPGTYWWWMGSAVNSAELSRELRVFEAAGLGGVHIIPIYGAKGYERQYLDYLSPQWLAMLRDTVREAERRGMFVDMTLGTGWCFGGPNVSAQDACALVDWNTLSPRPSPCPVKRAAPGGDGPMLNPFYGKAIRNYLERFTQAFAQYDGSRPRAVYHDSYEYQSTWSPDLLDEFAKRRGYRLQSELSAMQEGRRDDHAVRVRSDYRETVSDLVIEHFASVWTEWSRTHGFQSRYQAHGSPANLLDLYALADIPETEMFHHDCSVLVSKFASSAAHVAGRKRVASETGTWLKEHFTVTLSDLKQLVDRLFLSGVNHVFYHGTCYSPQEAPWPGWLFYASTQMNPRNAIWRDAPALNAYVARCQAVLQSGCPDNDVLVYWPIHDFWHNATGLLPQLTVHQRQWLDGQPIGDAAQRLWDRGIGFDFISDRQLAGARADAGRIATPGGAYRAVVIPPCDHMPPATLKRLATLAEGGASVVFVDRLPRDVPGAGDLEQRRAALRKTLGRLRGGSTDGAVRTVALGAGRVVLGPLEEAVRAAGVSREPMVDRQGLRFVRRAMSDGHCYFISYAGADSLDTWVPLSAAARSAAILDPMSGRTGVAALRRDDRGQTAVYLQLDPGQSLVVRTFDARSVSAAAWPYRRTVGPAVGITGKWRVQFLEGGPECPSPFETSALASWTRSGRQAAAFAGTACYTVTFDAPPRATGPWLLDLGVVCHSARVRLNGQSLGTVLMRPYRLPVEQLKARENVLEIEVTNLSANRIRDLDRRGVSWKRFHDVNFVGIDYRPFDASPWPLADSGLLGPVQLRRQEPLSP
ncbi:MAG: glycosyl hydrolase [Thermoguttaceae bacterium]